MSLLFRLHKCKFLKLQLKCLASLPVLKRVTDEGSLPEIVQYGPSSRFECFTASKGSSNYFYLLLLQLVLCRVAALKSLPVHHPQCRLYFSFDPLGSVNIFGVCQNYCMLRIITLTVF